MNRNRSSFLILAAFALSNVTPAHADDVVLNWAKSVGGSTNDIGQAIAVDASGSVYTTGLFHQTVDFDPGPEVFNLTGGNNEDIFVTKFDADGDFVWARVIVGTADNDAGTGIAVDAAGNVYVTGFFSGTVDFDPGQDLLNLTSAGGADVFLTKLNSDGDLLWARAMGGPGYDQGLAIALDAGGNAHITGRFVETSDFDPEAATFNLTSAGLNEAFVAKLDTDGKLLWAKSMGGVETDFGNAIAIDNEGNVHTCGLFSGIADFDPGSNVSNLASAGGWDIYVSKLDADGNYLWARNMGGASNDEGTGVALDASGNVLSTGYIGGGSADFDPSSGLFELNGGGVFSVFISKLNSYGRS
jgi:hypothetical protein